MSDEIEIVTRDADPGDRSPLSYRPFLVQCVNRQCLAYCDRDGHWRDYETDAEMPGPVHLLDAE